MDEDGIPLHKITNWQKALCLDQMTGMRPCITLPPIGLNLFRGVPVERLDLGLAQRNAAFCR